MRGARLSVILGLGVVVCPVQFAGATTMTSALTYQGRLVEKDRPAEGVFDLQFRLFTAANLGEQAGQTVTIEQQPITNGFFTVKLDFGSVYTGKALRLDIGAKQAGSGPSSLVPLAPHRNCFPVKYEQFTGYGLAAKIKARVILSFDVASYG